MVFSLRSPMVRHRVSRWEKNLEPVHNIRRKMEKEDNISLLIKWTLQVVSEAVIRKETEEKFVGPLISELNNLQIHCDNLKYLMYEKFTRYFTILTSIFLYVYFISAWVRLNF